MAKMSIKRVPNRGDFEKALWSSITRLFGEYGASRTDLSIIEYDQERGYAIIRCAHIALPMVRAAIAAITKIGDEEAAVHTLLVSGTLKSLKRRLTTNILAAEGKEQI